MTVHVYVDESKDRSYLLVTAVHASEELGDLRKSMRGLTLRGQRRVHTAKEGDSRRRAIAAALVGVGVKAIVYDAGRNYGAELDAREACLRALVEDAAARDDDTLLVIEQDDSLLDWDRRRLYALVRWAGVPGLRYEHHRAGADPLLAIPDVIAWCWAKRGDWRRRVQPAVVAVRNV